MKRFFFSLSRSAPDKFEIKDPTKRELLGSQVAFFTDSIDSFTSRYGSLTQRMCGLVITLEEKFSVNRLATNFWHLVVPNQFKDNIFDLAENFLVLINQTRDLNDENVFLKLEIERGKSSLKQSWINYSETIERLGMRIEELKNEILLRKKIERDLKYRVEFETLASDVTSKLAGAVAGNVETIVRNSLEQIGSFTKSSKILLLEMNDIKDSPKIIFSWNEENKNDKSLEGCTFTLKRDSLFFDKLSERENIFIQNVSDNSFWSEDENLFHIFDKNNSVVVIPVETSGRFFGFICHERTCENGAWSKEDQRILRLIGWTAFECFNRIRIEKELKESEEKFREITEMLPQAIIELDHNSFVTYANKMFFDLFEYSRQDLEQGISAFDFLRREDGETQKELFFEPLLAHKTGSAEYRGIKKNASVFPALFHACFVNENNASRVVRGIIFDLTEIKRSEEERLRLKKMESIGLLAGGIAHDFNNLLMGLFGNIEIAKMLTPQNEKSFAFLEVAEQAMENARKLTNQLLTFSKGGDPIKETLSLGEVILETAEFSLRGSNVKLLPEIQKDLWNVEADKSQISQVISNLIINAQQSMPEGGIIMIFAENCETNQERTVKITVKDNGIGIPASNLDKVFDPYFSTKQHGSGLGLTITHSIVSKHGGTISIESEKGEGTKVTIFLPAINLETQKRINEMKEKDAVSVKSSKILVLDDDEFLRDIIESMLQIIGHSVVCVSDGTEAVNEYKRSMDSGARFDAVISDLTIPGSIGGKEVAREILKIDPSAKIIVSSGYATDPIIAEYESYGFKSRLSKPFRFEDLKKAVSQVLKNPD